MRIINTYTFVFILAFTFISQSSFASPIPPQFFVEDFGVFRVEEEMILEWTISKDVDIDYFVIEKSNDNSDTFSEIGRIQVGNSQEDALFIFSDENLEKYNNYRIRVHLKNGMKQTSQVLKGDVGVQKDEEVLNDFQF
jgi:hypothetical protein